MSPPTQGFDNAPGAKRSGGGCLKWGIIGCSTMTVLGLLLVTGIVVIVFSAIRSSGAYQMALTGAQESPALREAVGMPMETGWWVLGSVNTSGPSGEASVSFPLSGPKGEATIHFQATKSAGEWQLGLLQAELQDGSRLDLLASGSASPY